ncbi:hypothetical protein LIER_28788 [Lithospermum erythrorhizon]
MHMVTTITSFNNLLPPPNISVKPLSPLPTAYTEPQPPLIPIMDILHELKSIIYALPTKVSSTSTTSHLQPAVGSNESSHQVTIREREILFDRGRWKLDQDKEDDPYDCRYSLRPQAKNRFP